MRRGYLILLDYIPNEDIYIDLANSRFIVTLDVIEEIVPLSKVKIFTNLIIKETVKNGK